jgi:hypothetical protein
VLDVLHLLLLLDHHIGGHNRRLLLILHGVGQPIVSVQL